MISSSRRFLFVHVPKTGGNSVQNVLRAYADDEVVCREPYQDGLERFELSHPTFGFSKHSPLSEYKAKLPPPAFDELLKFACVRNPWERAISFYFSPHRQAAGFSREAFVEVLATLPPMTYFLRAYEGQPLAEVSANFDGLMRFEDLQGGFDTVCDRLDIPRQALPVRNKSERGRVEDYYDEATVEIVRQTFAEDIELFAYDVPWA